MTQFSELRDASSIPWTQLSSITVLFFLLLTQNCSGLPQVVGPSQPVLATVGADVLLSCRLEPAVDASDMSIEWSREGLDPPYVCVWRGREELESSKHPDYKGRTSLLFSQLEFGDISLKLSNVKPSDKGKYRCFVPTLGRGSTVELVVGAASFPVISLAGLGRTSSSVELQCESAGWYPEPEVLWLDADGNLLSAGPTETVRGPNDLYTVISRVTVEKKHSNKFTCRVQQNNINQSREALIQVPDDFFKVQSSKNSSIVGLAVSLTAAFILFILAVFLFVRTRRQKRKKKTLVNEKQEEIERLERNLSETNNQLQQEKQENEKAESDMKTLKNQLVELERNLSETNNQLQQEKQEKEKAESDVETLKNQLEELKRNHSDTKNQLELEKIKIKNLEYQLEKVTSEVLKNILSDLSNDELHEFQQFLPAIKESRLQTPNRYKTVAEMVQTYGLQGAVQKTRMVLEKISRKDLLQRLPISSSAPEGYGNIMRVETTGASEETAQQDQLDYSGERASHTMAETDSERMEKYRSIIIAVGRKNNIEPALIAAIISRQSRAGNMLQDGWGANKVWGLMQVDTDPNGGGHKAKGAWDSEEHLCQGTEILVYFLIQIRQKFPSWTREQQLKGGIAAYMAGDGNVHSYENVDENTAGEDFSSDVVARAQWYKRNGF